MDFAWAINALKAGLKVTRKAWEGDPPMYLYMRKTKNGKRTVMFCDGSKFDREACFRPEAVLDITDWEEYVEPKNESMEKDLDEETIQALEQLAKIMAEGIAAIFMEDGIRRILQKKCMNHNTDSKARTDLPVWPEVNADGYARMSKDSDVIIHDGVYRCKKAPNSKKEG